MTAHRQWRYIAAAVQGTSHSFTGISCQDSFDMKLLGAGTDDEILILVASDGAGSATKAEMGARLACLEFSELMAQYVAEGGEVARITRAESAEWIQQIAGAITLKAKEYKCTLRDFACTFLAAVLSRDRAICLQIGDGAIVITDQGNYRPVFWPQSGEYANSTYFVTDTSVTELLQFAALTYPVDEVALLTDGLQMLALHYATRTVHAPFFRPMFARLRIEPPGKSAYLTQALVEYLDSAVVNKRTDDDKTLLLATRLAPESVVCTPADVTDTSYVPNV